jgi:hypothetical protein
MTLAETVRDIRHRLAELVAEHGRWNSLVDYEANRLIIQALSTELAAAHQRERIAQRELEALYQAMTERAQQAESRIVAALAILDEPGPGADLLRDALEGKNEVRS